MNKSTLEKCCSNLKDAIPEVAAAEARLLRNRWKMGKRSILITKVNRVCDTVAMFVDAPWAYRTLCAGLVDLKRYLLTDVHFEAEYKYQNCDCFLNIYTETTKFLETLLRYISTIDAKYREDYYHDDIYLYDSSIRSYYENAKQIPNIAIWLIK
jgi:hypothetical protein